MAIEKELLPCPFCDREAEKYNATHYGPKVRCTDPSGNCPGFNINAYVEEWNTRTPAAAMPVSVGDAKRLAALEWVTIARDQYEPADFPQAQAHFDVLETCIAALSQQQPVADEQKAAGQENGADVEQAIVDAYMRDEGKSSARDERLQMGVYAVSPQRANMPC